MKKMKCCEYGPAWSNANFRWQNFNAIFLSILITHLADNQYKILFNNIINGLIQIELPILFVVFQNRWQLSPAKTGLIQFWILDSMLIILPNRALCSRPMLLIFEKGLKPTSNLSSESTLPCAATFSFYQNYGP